MSVAARFRIEAGTLRFAILLSAWFDSSLIMLESDIVAVSPDAVTISFGLGFLGCGRIPLKWRHYRSAAFVYLWNAMKRKLGPARSIEEFRVIVVHHLDDSRSQRVLWLLEELGLPYDIKQHRRDRATRLAPAELKGIHPLGKSPVIEDNGRVVAESGAIIDYILRHHGDGRLLPEPSSASYDDFIYWMHYAEGSAMPALIIRINVARVGEAAIAALPRLDAEIALHLAYIDGCLEARPYLLGKEFTAADIQLSFVGELAAARFGIAEYRNVNSWVDRFQARPAYRAAVARGGTYNFAS